jgi:hypothetical protein
MRFWNDQTAKLGASQQGIRTINIADRFGIVTWIDTKETPSCIG